MSLKYEPASEPLHISVTPTSVTPLDPPALDTANADVSTPLLGFHVWLFWVVRALPTETNVESGTSQSKRGTSVDLSNSGIWDMLC